MRIKKITWQHRRDFRATYECEHCGHETEGGGYDDANYHENVIPAMRCPTCDKKAHENYVAMAAKYPEGFQI